MAPPWRVRLKVPAQAELVVRGQPLAGVARRGRASSQTEPAAEQGSPPRRDTATAKSGSRLALRRSRRKRHGKLVGSDVLRILEVKIHEKKVGSPRRTAVLAAVHPPRAAKGIIPSATQERVAKELAKATTGKRSRARRTGSNPGGTLRLSPRVRGKTETAKAGEEPAENEDDPTYDSRVKVFGPEADVGATTDECPALALQDEEAVDEVSDTKGQADDSEIL